MLTFKLALRPWRLNGTSQGLAAFTFGVLVLVFGFLTWFNHGLSPVIRDLSNDQLTIAYLDPALENLQPERVADEIRVSLGSHADSANLEWVNREGFLGLLEKSYPELAKEVGTLGTEAKWVAPQYVSIRGPLSAATRERISKITGVESTEVSTDRYRPIVQSLQTIQWITRIFIAAVLLGLLAILILIAQVNSSLYEESTQLVRQLGGARWTQKAPVVLSLALLGVMGGSIASLGWGIGMPWFLSQAHSLSPYLSSLSAPIMSAVPGFVIMGFIFGSFAGWVKSNGY